MTSLAPTLQSFFTQRLATQRAASPNTIASYRDTFCLLIDYTTTRTGKPASKLDLADLNAELIAGFLHHLEADRANSPRTRNTRLAAIRSLFHYAAPLHPEHAADIQRVLAIPQKRFDRAIVTFLTEPETEALLAAPNRHTWTGRRDHALLQLATQSGLRVSEITALTIADIQLGTPGAHVFVAHGKGRKQRATPITTSTIATMRVWLREQAGQPTDPLFPSRRGTPLSRDAVEDLVTKHAASAVSCPSLTAKTVTPHTLRHTSAMRLLHAGVDTTVIALWLGHESVETTQIYIHADLTIKEKALARTTPPNTPPGRYKPTDDLLAFLKHL